MGGQVIIGVINLILFGVLAFFAHLINQRLVQIQEEVLWYTGSMESYSAMMMRLEAKKQGVPVVWWNPEEGMSASKWPSTGPHEDEAPLNIIRLGMHRADRRRTTD